MDNLLDLLNDYHESMLNLVLGTEFNEQDHRKAEEVHQKLKDALVQTMEKKEGH